MKIKLRQVSGLAMVAVGDSTHWISMDGPQSFGGSAAASRPMELILMGLAGCSAMDVVSILKKKRVKLIDFAMSVEVEQEEEYPKIFTKIKLHYVFTGKNLQAIDLENAIELSENKYCRATAMLGRSAKIMHDYELIEQETIQ